ncbi:MAG: ABC transporter ATP-binding protein [Candidatus Cloacimonetes bacterium]|nr:ABC transporter ATP-binding protein [Candidatus Cloacimonadota bacterium]
MIKIINLSVGYKEQSILSGINLHFADGTLTALLGPNGAGKSTLLKCICGFLTPWQGSISINARNINSYRRQQLAQQVAIIPQNFQMQFDYEVRELVLMGRFPYLNYLGSYSREDYNIVDEILQQLDLTSLAQRNFSELSGGEQQRVAIARALAQQTPILLLDEAFASLDVNHSIIMMQLLNNINQDLGKTLILVSHNINLAAEFCPQAVILKDGSIVASGKTSNIITEETLSAVYEHPLKVITNPVSGQPNLVYSP